MLSSRPALLLACTAGLSLAIGSGAWAQEGAGGWHNGSWYRSGEAPIVNSAEADQEARPPQAAYPAPDRGVGYEPQRHDERYDHADYGRPPMPGREAWLADCRSRVASRDDGVGGAVIGGVVGGVAGNRIAGRGHRTVGTLAGAAVGAVAGSAIDRAEDRGRPDECEAYLDDYYAHYARGYDRRDGRYSYGYSAPVYPSAGYQPPVYAQYPQAGYGYAAPGCCMAPVMMVPVPTQPECTETVEYVYEDVPIRRKIRHVTPRTKIVHDKRIKIVADKTVYSK